MQSPTELDSLSFGDSLFLYLERAGTPLNIASVAIFDGIISLQELTSFIESKLPLIPRYLQKVIMPAFNVGSPSWEFDPDFDIHDHIHEATLVHGTETELKTLAGKILSTTLDRQHPLWDFTLIQGLKGNRSGLLVRVHHSLADGLSGIGLLNVLMDATPTVPRIVKKKLRIPTPRRSDRESSILEPAVHSWLSSLQRVLTAGDQLLTMAQHIVGTNANGSHASGDNSAPDKNGSAPKFDEIARLLPELTGLPERLPFNRLCQGPQRFQWTEVSFAELKAVKDKCGTKINDVILTLITSAFRRYSESCGTKVKGRSLRIIVPVNTRQQSDGNDLGNHISFVPVSTPLDIPDPRKLLAAIHERTRFVKSARLAEFVGFAGNLMGTIPGPLQSFLASSLSELPLSICNTICTNVPGPTFPLYLLGHKMVCAYPYVPIGGEMGMNCAVLTYNGQAFFGFTGDAHAAPHLEYMPKFVQLSMKELKAAVGVRAPRKTGQRNAAKSSITQPAVDDSSTRETKEGNVPRATAVGAS